MNLLKSLTNLFSKKKEDKQVTKNEPEEVEIKSPALSTRGNKLTEEQKIKLIHLMAQGLTPYQIVDKLKDEEGVVVSAANVYQYYDADKWKPMLKELREHYRNRLDLIDGSHKAVRIRRVEAIMDKAVKKGDLNVALKANEQTRKEFQEEEGGTTIYWNNPTYQQFNQLSNEELLKKQKEATEKLKIKRVEA